MASDTKKRILVLNYEFPPLGGGAANATYYLLKEFSKNPDLEIDLVTSSTDSFRIQEFANNVTIHFLDIGKKGNLHFQSNKDLLVYSWKAYRYAKALMRKNHFDLCHAFFGIPCGYIAMKLGLPYIVSLRGSDVPFYSKRFYLLDTFLFKRLSKNIWKRARAVVANSAGLRALALQAAPEQKIEVIFNGVDTQEFKPLPHDVTHASLKLISTGRLIGRKGYEYLIEAIAGMKDVELTLVGDGNLKHELEALAQERQSNVSFYGKKDHEEIVSLLQEADVFVLPSLNEGMSNSVLEAMATGLPIVATETGGIAELVKDNGMVVPKENAEALKIAIERLSADRSLVETMGRNSRVRAENMDWKSVAQEYLAQYDKI